MWGKGREATALDETAKERRKIDNFFIFSSMVWCTYSHSRKSVRISFLGNNIFAIKA